MIRLVACVLLGLLVLVAADTASAARGIVKSVNRPGTHASIQADETGEVVQYDLARAAHEAGTTIRLAVGEPVVFGLDEGRRVRWLGSLRTGVLVIEGTPKTPTISFDAGAGVLEIKGRSIPENSIEFYKPLVDFLDGSVKLMARRLTVDVALVTLDPGSFKALLEVFRTLEALHRAGTTSVTINWHYEEDDEDMLEAGEDYQAIINVPFKMVQIED